MKTIEGRFTDLPQICIDIAKEIEYNWIEKP